MPDPAALVAVLRLTTENALGPGLASGTDMVKAAGAEQQAVLDRTAMVASRTSAAVERSFMTAGQAGEAAASKFVASQQTMQAEMERTMEVARAQAAAVEKAAVGTGVGAGAGVAGGAAMAGTRVGESAMGWEKASKSIGNFSLLLGGAGLAAGYFSVKAGADFQQAEAIVHGFAGSTQRDMALYNRAILESFPRLGMTATNLSKGLYQVVSAGFRGAEGLDVLKESAMAATASQSNEVAVAAAVTSALNAYHLAGTQAAATTDILSKAVVEGKTTWDLFAPALARPLAIAPSLHASLADTTAAMSTLTDRGYTARLAGMGMTQMMLRLLAPMQTQEQTARAVGVNWQKLYDVGHNGLIPTLENIYAAAMKVDPALATVAHRTDLNTSSAYKFMQTQVTMNQKLSDLVGNARGVQTILALGSDGFARLTRNAEGTNNALGTTAHAFDIYSHTFAYQAEYARLNLERIGIAVSDAVLPSLTQLLRDTQPWMMMISHWTSENPKLVEGLLLAAGALVILGTGMKLMHPAVNLVRAGMWSYNLITGESTIATKELATAQGAGVGPAGSFQSAQDLVTGGLVAENEQLGLAITQTQALNAEQSALAGAGVAGYGQAPWMAIRRNLAGSVGGGQLGAELPVLEGATGAGAAGYGQSAWMAIRRQLAGSVGAGQEGAGYGSASWMAIRKGLTGSVGAGAATGEAAAGSAAGSAGVPAWMVLRKLMTGSEAGSGAAGAEAAAGTTAAAGTETAGTGAAAAGLSATGVGLIVVGLAAAAIGAVVLYEKFKPFHKAVDEAGHSLEDRFKTAIHADVVPAFQWLEQEVGRVFEGIGGDIRTAERKLTDMAYMIRHLPVAGGPASGAGDLLGWAGTSTGAITGDIGQWMTHRTGLAGAAALTPFFGLPAIVAGAAASALGDKLKSQQDAIDLAAAQNRVGRADAGHFRTQGPLGAAQPTGTTGGAGGGPPMGAGGPGPPIPWSVQLQQATTSQSVAMGNLALAMYKGAGDLTKLDEAAGKATNKLHDMTLAQDRATISSDAMGHDFGNWLTNYTGLLSTQTQQHLGALVHSLVDGKGNFDQLAMYSGNTAHSVYMLGLRTDVATAAMDRAGGDFAGQLTAAADRLNKIVAQGQARYTLGEGPVGGATFAAAGTLFAQGQRTLAGQAQTALGYGNTGAALQDIQQRLGNQAASLVGSLTLGLVPSAASIAAGRESYDLTLEQQAATIQANKDVGDWGSALSNTTSYLDTKVNKALGQMVLTGSGLSNAGKLAFEQQYGVQIKTLEKQTQAYEQTGRFGDALQSYTNLLQTRTSNAEASVTLALLHRIPVANEETAAAARTARSTYNLGIAADNTAIIVNRTAHLYSEQLAGENKKITTKLGEAQDHVTLALLHQVGGLDAATAASGRLVAQEYRHTVATEEMTVRTDLAGGDFIDGLQAYTSLLNNEVSQAEGGMIVATLRHQAVTATMVSTAAELIDRQHAQTIATEQVTMAVDKAAGRFNEWYSAKSSRLQTEVDNRTAKVALDLVNHSAALNKDEVALYLMGIQQQKYTVAMAEAQQQVMGLTDGMQAMEWQVNRMATTNLFNLLSGVEHARGRQEFISAPPLPPGLVAENKANQEHHRMVQQHLAEQKSHNESVREHLGAMQTTAHTDAVAIKGVLDRIAVIEEAIDNMPDHMQAAINAASPRRH